MACLHSGPVMRCLLFLIAIASTIDGSPLDGRIDEDDDGDAPCDQSVHVCVCVCVCMRVCEREGVNVCCVRRLRRREGCVRECVDGRV